MAKSPMPLCSTIRIRNVFLSLGVLSVGLALATRVYFTSGAFEFEGVGAHAEPRGRWVGQRSVIPVYGPESLWVFKTDILTKAGKIRLIPPSGEVVTLDVTKVDQAYLPMFTNGTLWPSRHSIVFEKAYDSWYRQVAGQIIYPPILIRIPLLMTRGASELEPAGAGMSVLCGQQCMLAVLHNRGRPTTVHVELERLSSPVESRSGSVQMTAFASSSHDVQVSLNVISDLVPLKRTVSSSSGRSDRIAFDIPAASGWYTVRITANRAVPDLEGAAVKVLITESPAAASN